MVHAALTQSAPLAALSAARPACAVGLVSSPDPFFPLQFSEGARCGGSGDETTVGPRVKFAKTGQSDVRMATTTGLGLIVTMALLQGC